MASSLVSYTTASTDNAGTGTINLPAGAISGDVLILFIAKDGTNAPSVSGFINRYSSSPIGGSSHDSLWWKVVTAEPSSYTITNNGNERSWFCLAAFREVDNADPFESFASYLNPSNNANMEVPAITRSFADQMCVAFMGIESGNSGNPLNPTWGGAGWTTTSDNQNGPPGTGSGSAAGAFATQQTASTGTLGPDPYSYGGGNSTGTTLAFALRLGASPEVGINSTDNEISGTDTNIPINGFGFETVQGSGKVEIGDSSNYSTATLVEQTIASWSDTQILYDATGLSILTDGVVYLYVTDSEGNRAVASIIYGLPPYEVVIANSSPDHWWTFDGNYDDEVGSNPFTLNNIATNGFASVVISEGTTQSWRAQNGRRECPNSGNMNLTTTLNRLMGGWIRLGGIPATFSCIYEEGGSINNLAFFLGIGNTLIAQLADTGDDNVQAFSDFSLEPNRDYHILFRFSYTDGTNKLSLYIDGVEQSASAGNPLTATNLDAHSGDISIGGPGGNLEVGGTDVLFRNQEDTYFSNWVTYSVETSQALIADLFRRGAVPTYTILGTEAQMQTQLDALAGTLAENAPLTLRVLESSSGDLDLILDSFTFNDSTSIQLEYRGGGTLNVSNLSGSNLEPSKTYASQGGTITVSNPSVLALTGLQPNTEVRVYLSGTETELAGVENSGTAESFGFFGVSLIDIVIHNLDYVFIRLDAVDVSTSIALPIQQQFDRNYENP